ncbi:hypothetical protein HMSSN139_32770 [Paenibacillus sp. HMSSN-139]|nr:hypothetical protein HMSSN139_32770 [Paenibacillus sp. HMSSN-139]
MSEVRQKAERAGSAVSVLNRLTTAQKNEALLAAAEALVRGSDAILAANEEDLQRGRDNGTSSSMLDRLALTPERIESIAEGLRQIAELPDPVGDVLETIDRPNGLHIVKRRVPLGVIGIVYEARPNVTVDAMGLCLKRATPLCSAAGPPLCPRIANRGNHPRRARRNSSSG